MGAFIKHTFLFCLYVSKQFIVAMEHAKFEQNTAFSKIHYLRIKWKYDEKYSL